MKTTLITTFAIAVMIFAFNANPAHATEESNKKVEKELKSWVCPDGGEPIWGTTRCRGKTAQVDELSDPDQDGNERDIADSGNEGSTSAASAGDQ